MTENAEAERKERAKRVPSAISFPYTDMSDAIAVAEGLLKGGGVPLSRDQLAAAMGLAPGGGGFAAKVSTARTFGILESVGGKYQLTEIGYEIVDASRQAEAKVKAFMSVELYKRTFDEFRGKLLPPRPHGLDNAFVSFGVSQKNVQAARLAFEKSARLAGLYPGGNEDRLVIPFGAPAVVANEPPPSDPTVMSAAIGATLPARAFDNSAGLHPSIAGMLSELPAPKSEWGKVEQADWLDALAGMFRVIYKSPNDKGDITVVYQPPTKEPGAFS